MAKTKEIRITSVTNSIHAQIKNIADYEGMCVSTFLRRKLREITNEYPDDVKFTASDLEKLRAQPS